MAIGSRPAAGRIDPPDLRAFGALESDLVERDRQLHLVAEVGQPAGGEPDRVPRIVEIPTALAPPLGIDAFGLHAKWIDPELVGPAFVVEGVEHDPDPIISSGLVAVTIPGADRFRFVVIGAECHQNAVFVIGYEDHGPYRWLDVLTGADLVFQFESQCVLPGLLVEYAIDRNLRCRPGNRMRFLGLRRFLSDSSAGCCEEDSYEEQSPHRRASTHTSNSSSCLTAH